VVVAAMVLLAELVVPTSGATAAGAPVGRLVARLQPPDTLFTADVTDPDGGPLTYTWTGRIECGTFAANSPAAHQAVWSHPSGEPPGGCPHEDGTDHTGTVTVIVRDQQGNQLQCTHEGSGDGSQDCTIYGEDIEDCRINLRLFDGQAGGAPRDDREESRGAFTVLNRNNTDAANGRDLAQERVRGEKDLMRLRLLPPQPDAGGLVTLEIPSGSQRISFWRSSSKGTQLRPDPALTFPTSRLPLTLWVEGRRASRRVRDVTLEYSYRPPLSDSPCTDTAKATIVWGELRQARHDAGDRIWADLQGSPRPALERYCGGFGLRPRGPRPQGVRNCIGLQFALLPAGIAAERNVRYDIARQKHSDFVITDAEDGRELQRESSRFPSGERPNDDGHDRDESAEPSANGFLYSFDGPGTPEPETRAGVRASYEAEFREYLRVRFDGERPTGNQVNGTVASPIVRWEARHTWRTDRQGRIHRTTGDEDETRRNYVRLG
jgi:hypothetical protein